MKTFGTIVAGILCWLLSIFVGGVVLMFLWNWFIVPLGVIKIGFWLAFGISLTIKFFIGLDLSRDKDNSGFFSSCFASILASLLTWGLAAIIQLFI